MENEFDDYVGMVSGYVLTHSSFDEDTLHRDNDDIVDSIEFFLPMLPPTVTAQQHRAFATKNGKTVFVDTPELKDAKQKYLAYLYKHRIDAPMRGALRLVTKWCFPARSAHHAHGEYKTTRPDTDNMIKAFKDCLGELKFFENDAQIASEIIEKYWSDVPGIYVCLEKI